MRITSLILLLGLVCIGLRAAGNEVSDLSGVRTTSWPNGNPREQALYSEGLRDGLCERWHTDGTSRAEGHYEAGRMVGEWHFYDAKGSLNATRSGLYEAGERISPLGR